MSRSFTKRFAVGLSLAALIGCDAANHGDLGQTTQAVTDVNHTAVEGQSIGNCWLYAQATWAESMKLTASGEELDTSPIGLIGTGLIRPPAHGRATKSEPA